MTRYKLTVRYYAQGKPSIAVKEHTDVDPTAYIPQNSFETLDNGSREVEYFTDKAALDARIAEIKADTADW